jgi:hypothetical protein
LPHISLDLPGALVEQLLFHDFRRIAPLNTHG